jgi:predicted MFS family arabinose efflux permease
MVVAMSLARGLGAAVGPNLFDAFGLPGPAVAAVAADIVAAVVLIVWVREKSESSVERPPTADKRQLPSA